MATSFYDVGSVTLTNGSAVVTGVGTLWQTALITNGMLVAKAAGNVLLIESVDSDSQITAEQEWVGATGTYDYGILRQTDQMQDNAENSRALAYVISEIRNGTLFKYDAAGTLADRALYNERPKGFSYLVFAGTSAQLYVKASATSGDWAGPYAYGTGPTGPMGPAGFTNFRGTYAAGTTYVRNDGVLYNGSSWVALQATTGNAPPNLPTTSNTYWSLLASKGLDGTGIGDMLASVYDPQNKQADAFDRSEHTGKQPISSILAAYAAKAANYTALPADAGATLRFTSSATLSLTAAATLGNGFTIEVIADGGNVTIDPNGSETINGRATLVVPNGGSALLICDGTGFYTRVKPTLWESIEVANPSAVGFVAFTNLGTYRFLRAHGFITPASGGAVYYQTSTDNGSIFDAGAADYTSQSLVGFNSASGAGAATANAAQITFQSATLLLLDTIFANFNAATAMLASSKNLALAAGGASSEIVGSYRNSGTPRNALRISMSVNFTGRIYLEGIRG